MAGKDGSKAAAAVKKPKKPPVKSVQGSRMGTRRSAAKIPPQDQGVSRGAAPGKPEDLRQAKNAIGHEAESLATRFEQGGQEARLGATGGGGRPRRRWKKGLIMSLAGINVVLLVSVAIAFSKPAWVGHVKGWFSPSLKRSAVYKRSLVRPSLAPDFNRTIPQRPQIAARTMPPPTQAPRALPQEPTRPQTGIPRGVGQPPAVAPATPPAQSQDLDEYLEVGALYAQKGRYQKAEELFKKVIQGNPSSAQAHNNLGFVYIKQGKYEAAEREFKESLRLDPASALTNYNLACLYSRTGQTSEALIYLNRALKKDARVKAWALADEDFAKIRSDVVFQELVGAPAPKAAPEKQKDVQKQEGAQKPVVPQKPLELQKRVEPQKQLEPQKPEGTQGVAPNQEDAHSQKGLNDAHNQEGVQGAAPNQKELQGGAQGVQGDTNK